MSMKKYFLINLLAVVFCSGLMLSASAVGAAWSMFNNETTPAVSNNPLDNVIDITSLTNGETQNTPGSGVLLPDGATNNAGTSVTSQSGAAQSQVVPLTNPLTGGSSVLPIPTLVKNITTVAIGLSGVMALLAFVYGGILYLLAGVNMDFLKKGKEVMKWAIIGLFVIFSSYAVINFVMTKLLGLS